MGAAQRGAPAPAKPAASAEPRLPRAALSTRGAGQRPAQGSVSPPGQLQDASSHPRYAHTPRGKRLTCCVRKARRRPKPPPLHLHFATVPAASGMLGTGPPSARSVSRWSHATEKTGKSGTADISACILEARLPDPRCVTVTFLNLKGTQRWANSNTNSSS